MVALGDRTNGGYCNGVKDHLIDAKAHLLHQRRFEAVKAAGSVVAWGDNVGGGGRSKV